MGSLVLWQVRRQPEEPKVSFKSLTSTSWDNPLDSAAISPDGTYLAFCSMGKLVVQVIRSGEKSPLALPEGFYPANVDWFAAGTKLLLARAETGWLPVTRRAPRQAETSLWSLSILGGNPQPIVDHVSSGSLSQAFGSSVSPDGSLVAFSRYDPERQATDI